MTFQPDLSTRSCKICIDRGFTDTFQRSVPCTCSTGVAKRAEILQGLSMRRLKNLAYSSHRDAGAAYDEMERRAEQAGGWAALHKGRGLLVNVQMDCGDI